MLFLSTMLNIQANRVEYALELQVLQANKLMPKNLLAAHTWE